MLALPASPTRPRTGARSGAGRPTTANAYTGSAATTRARSSTATQGMALARWKGGSRRSLDDQVDPGAVDVDTRAEAGRGERLQHQAAAPGGDDLVEHPPVAQVEPEGAVEHHRRPDQPAGLQDRAGHPQPPPGGDQHLDPAGPSWMAQTEVDAFLGVGERPVQVGHDQLDGAVARGSATGMERAYPLLPRRRRRPPGAARPGPSGRGSGAGPAGPTSSSGPSASWSPGPAASGRRWRPAPPRWPCRGRPP